jgi:hypothetical protein
MPAFVAFANEVTRRFDLMAADVQVDSLEELPLADLVFRGRRRFVISHGCNSIDLSWARWCVALDVASGGDPGRRPSIQDVQRYEMRWTLPIVRPLVVESAVAMGQDAA